MTDYGYVIFFSLVGGLFSLVGGALLLSSKKAALALAIYATPFAAGALIATVFMDLLSEGVTEADPSQLFLWTMVGIVLFYLAERSLRWFHHHHSEHEPQTEADEHHASVPLIVAGDTIHNALDGVVIAAAFLVSVPTGILTALVVAAHEIPQETGDFGLLLSKGLSRMTVLLVNVVSSLATLGMALVTFALGSAERLPMGILLGLSAGFLLYIAMSDIMPELHRHIKREKRLLNWQPLLLVLGAVVVTFVIQFAHGYMEHGHEHQHTSTHTNSAHNDEHEHERDTRDVDH